MDIGLLILLALVSVGGIIVIIILFVKWVVPALGLLKNRMLVEEREEEKDNESIPVPPSSDRNQVGNNLDSEREGQAGTE